ncbi:uncharacterized protein BO88DRAFT_83344, partial [Aspergillus vadensis CBS 113365]
MMGVLGAGGHLRAYFSPACAEWTSGYIVCQSAISARIVPPCRYRASEVQNYLWQYRNCPIGAVSDVFGFSSKPQPHSHLDIVRAKRIIISFPWLTSLLVFNGHIHSIWVIAVIMSQGRAHNDESYNQPISLSNMLQIIASLGIG